jgi:hypothetical protein
MIGAERRGRIMTWWLGGFVPTTLIIPFLVYAFFSHEVAEWYEKGRFSKHRQRRPLLEMVPQILSEFKAPTSLLTAIRPVVPLRVIGAWSHEAPVLSAGGPARWSLFFAETGINHEPRPQNGTAAKQVCSVGGLARYHPPSRRLSGPARHLDDEESSAFTAFAQAP